MILAPLFKYITKLNTSSYGCCLVPTLIISKSIRSWGYLVSNSTLIIFFVEPFDNINYSLFQIVKFSSVLEFGAHLHLFHNKHHINPLCWNKFLELVSAVVGIPFNEKKPDDLFVQHGENGSLIQMVTEVNSVIPEVTKKNSKLWLSVLLGVFSTASASMCA